ncbi:Ubiquitin-conjugating enzyme spm2 [Penicillium diatomitis]|uniref:Ubiquitin-conjugating enzyme spm2 n=1 Tax=Penicillium diatomitis TaxID=2819901 RepID=A0A9X0BSJ5_9EURO|nr:Ubiquitin-conjugating enzyme spm2 [Penicillium diatomitis]KAJ5482648.1 Ubiquitin-conjugating enzyme spm2 [Penicillium diatomitis]
MHKVLVPNHSGVHRFACLALYRALLRQCSPSSSVPAALQQSEGKTLLRQRFRKYKKLQSPSQIANALKAGYEALDLLDRARKGGQHEAEKFNSIVARAKMLKEQQAAYQREIRELHPSDPVSPKQIRKEATRRFEEATSRKHPDSPGILERPRPTVSGQRRIPVLVNARGVPFLRIKKPQPKNLSGVIRSKLERRWNRIVTRDRLAVELLFAKDEDQWDKLTETAQRPSWAEGVKRALDDVYEKIRKSDKQNRELSEKMWKIVLEERALVGKESPDLDCRD